MCFELYQGDCLSLIPKLDLTNVNLVLTDPPYGHGVMLRQNKDETILNNDSTCVGQAVCDWAEAAGLPTVAFASPKLPWKGTWRQHLVWDKGPGVGMGDLKRTWKPCWELIQIARNGRLRGRRDSSVLRYPVSSRDFKDHPTVKPVALLRYLIEQLTDPGDTIFDPFMGIGSTGVACRLTGRNFIGIELDQAHYDRAVQRLEGQQGS